MLLRRFAAVALVLTAPAAVYFAVPREALTSEVLAMATAIELVSFSFASLLWARGP
jgi:hypothetical protein